MYQNQTSGRPDPYIRMTGSLNTVHVAEADNTTMADLAQVRFVQLRIKPNLQQHVTVKMRLWNP